MNKNTTTSKRPYQKPDSEKLKYLYRSCDNFKQALLDLLLAFPQVNIEIFRGNTPPKHFDFSIYMTKSTRRVLRAENYAFKMMLEIINSLPDPEKEFLWQDIILCQHNSIFDQNYSTTSRYYHRNKLIEDFYSFRLSESLIADFMEEYYLFD